MKKLSKRAAKRIIAGSLALALTFTSIGLYNFSWADEPETSTQVELEAEKTEEVAEELDTTEELPDDSEEPSDNSEESAVAEDSEQTTDNEAVFELSAKEINLKPNDSFNLNAKIGDLDVSDKIILSTESEIVELSGNVITAKSVGQCEIAVSYSDENNSFAELVNVTISEDAETTEEPVYADDFVAEIQYYSEPDPLLVSSEDEIQKNLPKTVQAGIYIKNNTKYDAQSLINSGFTGYNDSNDFFKPNASVEVVWEQVGTNNLGGIEFVGHAKSSNFTEGEVAFLKTTAYIYDGEFSGNLCPHCFAPLAKDGNCVACHSTNCTCQELDLDIAFYSRIQAWVNKYMPNGSYELLTNYDNTFFDSLSPNTQEIVKDYFNVAKISDYFDEITINELLTYINDGKISFDETELAFLGLSLEQAKEIAKYNFTSNDVVNYYDAYNNNGYSELFIMYKNGQRSDAVNALHEMIKSISPKIHTTLYTASISTQKETKTAKEESLLDKIKNTFVLSVSAASGDGWYDDKAGSLPTELGVLRKGNKQTYEGKSIRDLTGYPGIDKYMGQDELFGMCLNPDKDIISGRPFYKAELCENAPYYAAVKYANDNKGNPDSVVIAQAAAWYLSDGSSQSAKNTIMKNFGQNSVFQELIAAGPGPVILWKPIDNQNRLQNIATVFPLTDNVGLSLETGVYSDSATTTYKSDIDKYSVITNEKLSGINFTVKEEVGANPQNSADVNASYNATVTTDANGHAEISTSHSASWECSYTQIKDEAAIVNYINSGDASNKFVNLYNSYKSQIDNNQNGYTSKATAQNYVNTKKNAFLAIEYKYTWTELDSFTRNASSPDQNGKSLSTITLPKQGYRKNITTKDNNNAYSNVTESDLTSASIKTSPNVKNGGNGHVDISNQPWRAQIFINKTDLETNNQIVYDTAFDIYEYNNGSWIQNNYKVVRITDAIATQMGWDKSTVGMYTVAYVGNGFGGKNPADNYNHTPLAYGTVYYTQANQGKFKIVETKAPASTNNETGYIGNFVTRPYTRIDNSEDRYALSGVTDKYNFTNHHDLPQVVSNDIAQTKIEHEFQLCADTDQYENFMLTDTGISTTPVYQGNYYSQQDGYDTTSHHYVGATVGDTNGVEKLYYTGTYTDTKNNYNSFVPGDAASDANNKNTYSLAKTLNDRHGYNNKEFVSVESPQLGREYAFINERVKGFIRVTKFDKDANRYVAGNLDNNYRDGTQHADASLDGAIYSLYVDDSTGSYNKVQISNGGVIHPDGNKTNTAGAAESAKYYNDNGIAVLRNQQQFVDTDGDGFGDTWKVVDVTLKPGVKVASAVVKNGELEFDGLYPGNYYIVEEVRSVEKVYGLDENDNEVYDENWLSFAPGYLADVYKATDNTYVLNKQFYTVGYTDETNYVKKDTDNVSYETIIKGKVRLVKVTSDETVGSTTNNLDTESGAGFTVYKISELSKIKNGIIQPMWSLQVGNKMVEDGTLVKLYDDQKQFVGYKLADPQAYGLEGELRHTNRFVMVPGLGYYQMDQILSAYMNEVYSNEVAKWGQFENESQAIARVYEKDPSVIAKANADYRIIPGNHAGAGGAYSAWYGKSGIGDGYVNSAIAASKYAYATNTASSRTTAQTSNEYVLSELFTNTRGQIKIPQLAWGAYLIVNTTVPKDKGAADPVFVTISDSTDDNSVTTAEPPYNSPITPYNGIKYRVRIVKRDAQTGQNVLQANTKFRIWDYQAQEYLRLTTQGTAGIASSTCIFTTDESGFVNYDALSMLEIGRYRIEEVEGPSGYWNAYWDYGNPSSENKLFTDKLGYTHYTIDSKQKLEFTNDPNGNVTTDDASVANIANMREKNYGAVDFQVTTDRKWVSAAIVSDVLTNENNVDILYIGESYTNSETLGMLTIMKTGEVLVGYDNTDNIEYKDEYKKVTKEDNNQNKTYKTRKNTEENIEEFNISTDRDSTQTGKGTAVESKYFDNDLMEASYDYDDDTYDFVYEERPLAGATFQIIAAENIYTQDKQVNESGQRSTWFKQGDVVATVTTARNGEVMNVIPNYQLADGETQTFASTSTVNGATFTEEYTNKDFQTTGRIDNKWIDSRMSDIDKAIYGVPSFTDETIKPNSYVNEDGEQQVIVRVIKDGTLGQVSVLLPLGKYTIKEVEAPYGYVLSEYSGLDSEKTSQTIDVEFNWKDQIKEVVFNTDDESVEDTASKINSFKERNLAWYKGGTNEYSALNSTDKIGVTVDQSTHTVVSKLAKNKHNTFTDGFIHEDLANTIGDAEVQYYTDEQGFTNFYDERVKANASKDNSNKKYLSVGIYKVDAEDTNKTLEGAKFGLYTKDDIYNVDGELLVPANTRLAVATTNKDGFAEFEVDIPYTSSHYGNTTSTDNELYNDGKTVSLSLDGNTTANSGVYYVKELTAPDGYLFNDEVIEGTLDKSTDLVFNPLNTSDSNHNKQLLYPVYGEQRNKQTEVRISKRDITNEKEIAGATLEVYEVLGKNGDKVVFTETGDIDWTKCTLSEAIDTWTSEADTTHVIRGLELSNREVPRLNNEELREHVYLLREISPANGYVTANDIVFEVAQNYTVNADGTIKWDIENNTVYVLKDVTVPYATGVLEAQSYYTDHDGADKYNYNHDYYNITNDKTATTSLIKDDVKEDISDNIQETINVANWMLIDNVLIIDIDNDATLEAVSHAFTSKRVAEAVDAFKNSNNLSTSDIKNIYFVSNNKVDKKVLETAKSKLFAEDGLFSENMLINELPDEVAQLLDSKVLNGDNPELKVVPTYEWTSCNDAYNTIQKVITEEYGGIQFDSKPTRSTERTIIMEDERTKLFISKADITNDSEIVGAFMEIIDKNGDVVDSWISDGEDHYVELLPIGEYTLKETQAPTEKGYVCTSDVKFTIDDDKHVNVVYMPDNYTRVKITKSDIVNGERVIGATLAIYNNSGHKITWNGSEIENDGLVTEWVTTDEDTYIEKLPVGTYRLVETQTAPNYTKANDIIFTIKDEDAVTKVDMKDDFSVVEISKTDLVTEQEVKDAKLELYAVEKVLVKEETENIETGEKIPAVYEDVEKLIVSWTTGDKDSIKISEGVDFVKANITSDGKIELEYLPVGKYILKETQPASGYTTASDVEIEVVDKLYHYDTDNETILKDKSGNVIANKAEIIKSTMKDDFTIAKISKVDATNKKEISGAKLEIYAVNVDKNNKPIYVNKTDKDGNVLKDEDGNIIKVASRIDADKEQEGINPLYSWTSGDDGLDKSGNVLPHTINYIPVGTYVLVETSAPEGYLIADEQIFTVEDKLYHFDNDNKVNIVDGKIVANENKVVKVTMEDERALMVSKQNIVTGQEIEGAKLAIYEFVESSIDENGNIVEHDYSKDTPVVEWTSSKTPRGINIDLLEIGDEYALVEQSAPDGYFLAESILFRLVDKEGTDVPEIQVYDETNDKFVSVKDRTIVMKDNCTRVNVYKIDSENDNFVVGAQLGIYKVSKNILGIETVDWNNPVVTFTTNGNYTDILALPVGKYVLHEIAVPNEVPNGYKSWKLAADIEFEVTNADTTEDPLIITMVDELVKAETPVEPQTQPQGPVPTPETIVVETVPTGDQNNILPFIFGGISLIVAACASIVLVKRKDDDDEEGNKKES